MAAMEPADERREHGAVTKLDLVNAEGVAAMEPADERREHHQRAE